MVCLWMISDLELGVFINYVTLMLREKVITNKVAHNLARYVSCILDFVMWMEDGSPHFLSFDQADIVVFSYYYAFFPLRKIINKKNLATYNI